MIMSKFIELAEIPKPGQTVEVKGGELPTVGEVEQVVQKGAELWAIVRAARADGRIERHEALLIISKGVELAGLSIWAKIGRFFRRLFGKKS